MCPGSVVEGDQEGKIHRAPAAVPIQDPPQKPIRTTATAGDTEPDAQGPQKKNEDLSSRQQAVEPRCSAVGHQVCSGGQGAPLS